MDYPFKIHIISCQGHSRPNPGSTFQCKESAWFFNVISCAYDEQSYCATVKINVVQKENSIKAFSLEMNREVGGSRLQAKTLALALGC